ncbi:MAG: ferredoxin [Curvibacter sp.]
MYIILTSKDGEFDTEAGDGIQAVETHDYYFYGQHKATFVISELQQESRIQVRSAGEPTLVNSLPTKFLEKFNSLEAARRELASLTLFGNLQTQLVKRA